MLTSAPVSALSSVDLPVVGVARERDFSGMTEPCRAARCVFARCLLSFLEPAVEGCGDATSCEPAVRLELRLARASVPTPPPRRSRCFHMPRMRGRLYS